MDLRIAHMRARSASGFRRVLLAAALAALPLASAEAQDQFPPSGQDSFDSMMTINLDVISGGQAVIQLTGPVTVLRSDPEPPGGAPGGASCVIRTEIAAMDLVGDGGPLGQVRLRANPNQSSTGEVQALGPDCEFPADSFFDVFVVVRAAALPFDLVNLLPVRIEAVNLLGLPPLFDTYTHPPTPVPLVSVDDPGLVIATIAGDSTHTPDQVPTFSVAAGGPSALDAADLLDFGNPPVTRIAKENLGLGSGDDLDALSYGLDVFDLPPHTSVVFSVDANAVGRPNTGVNREAMGDEAEGDEFMSLIDNSNRELLDEQAIVLIQGMPGDDLDALTNQPTRVVDQDESGVPERPVFFSLTPSSPTVTGGSFSAADIFFSVNGAAPGIFATAEDIGLVEGDDIDGMCLMKAGLPFTDLRPGVNTQLGAPPLGALSIDHLIFSLAPGSPSLLTLGVGPGDLLISNFANSRISIFAQPQLYTTAESIGLEGTDNLNALKCLTQATILEVDGDGVGFDDGKGNIFGGACGTGGTAGTAGRTGLVLINITNPAGPQPDPTVAPEDRPLPGQPGFYEVWAIRNEDAPDFHGPYAIPGSSIAALGTLPVLEPTSLNWGINQGDNCKPHHLHEFFYEGHFDPDGPNCGHGKQVQYFGAVVQIPPGATPRDIARLALEAFNQSQVPVAQHVHINWHAYDGPSLNPNPILPCNGSASSSLAGGAIGPAGSTAASERAVLIFTGTGPTKIDVSVHGADGIRVSPAQPNAPVPLFVPEPRLFPGVAAGLVALGLLRRLRRSS